MPAPARIGLFRVLDDLVGALTRERWAVERPTPRVVDTITTRDSRTKRRQLKEPLQRLIELIPKGTAVLTKSTDPREILQDAQTAVREMLEAVVAGGIYQRGDGFPSGDYVGLCLRPMENRSEEHTSELQSRLHLVCRLLLEKKKKINKLRNNDTEQKETESRKSGRHCIDH